MDRITVTNIYFMVNKDARIVELNPLNAKLNPTCHLLALLRDHPIFYINSIRVNKPFQERSDSV